MGNCSTPEGLTNIKAISAGRYQPLALKEDGTVTALIECVFHGGLIGSKIFTLNMINKETFEKHLIGLYEYCSLFRQLSMSVETFKTAVESGFTHIYSFT